MSLRAFQPVRECAWAGCKRERAFGVRIINPCCGFVIFKGGICSGHRDTVVRQPQAQNTKLCPSCGTLTAPKVGHIEHL